MPLCVFAALLLLDPPPLLAKNAVVQATIDTNRTTIDTPVSLSVTIAADRGEVDTSPIKDFKIISRSTSSSIQIINGNVNRQRIFTYMLLPLKEGKLIIPSLSVAIDGKKSYTEPIVVHVSKGMATAEASAGIRISGRVNDVHPYLGQQIVYTFRLLYGVQISNTNYEAPSFKGFSAKQIGKQKTGQTIIDGRPFQEVTISYLLVPLKTGPISIGPATLQCDTMHPRPGGGSMFDSFFKDPFFSNSQLVPKVFRTSEISIRVLPLPAWTGPEDFSGLVGQFDMKAALETHKTTVGDSVTLSVTLAGKGNLQDAEAPQFRVPAAFKQYADQPKIHVQLEPDGYVGSKVFKTALVPVKAGSYNLTTAPMVYFDPKAKTYRRLSVAPLSLMVRKSGKASEAAPEVSPPNTGSNEPALKKSKVDVTGHDILSIKTGLDALSNQNSIPTAGFLGILAAPGALFLLIFCVLKIAKRDDSPAAVMTRKSQTALKKALHDAGSDSADLLSNLYRALLYAVFAKARTPGESLTQGEAEALLKQHGVDGETAADVSALFSQLESARFGSAGLSTDQEKALVSKTARLVKGLVR